MLRRARPGIGAIAALVAACGGRSSLVVGGAPDPEAGAGGASSGTVATTSSGGTGGAGGAAACSELVLAGPPRRFTGVAAFDERRPKLVATTADRVALLWGWDGVEEGFVLDKLGVVGFAPWGAWPDESLGQSWLVMIDGGASFATAPGTGPDTVALLLNVDSPIFDPPDQRLYFGASVATEKPGGFLGGAVPVDDSPRRPLFVANGGERQLMGYERELAPEHFHLTLARGIGGLPQWPFESVGCGTSPLVADAAPAGGSILVAYSSSRPFGSCMDDDGIDGPPTEIQIAVDSGEGSPQPGAALAGDDIVASVALVPATEGAWIVWQRWAQAPRLELARVDAAGALAGQPFALDVSAVSPPAVAGMGDRVAIARLDAADPSAPSVAIELRDEVGALHASTSFQPGAGAWSASELALLASPERDHLLLAWSELPEDGGARRVRVARFDCVP